MDIAYFVGKENVICRDSLETVLKALKEKNQEVSKWKGEKAELLLVFGGDGALLQALQKMGDSPIPVLGVNCGELGFMMEVNHTNFRKFVPPLLKGEYKIEKRDRLQINRKEEKIFALNEVVVTPKEAATLMRYTLKIDGEKMWRDSADSIVVSTPTGSTAYALSAGGPIIAPKAQVFQIVPNNSVNHSRRPLILPAEAKAEIDIVDCPVDCELILDGKKKKKCGNKVNVSMSDKPALFVRMLPSYSALSSKIKKKVDVFDNHSIRGESPSSKFILKTIEFEGPLTQKEIIAATQLPARTVRRNLENLIKKNVVVKKPFLEDPRQSLYVIAN